MSFQRTAIVTGGTMNLGLFAAQTLAHDHPDWLVVIASRSDKDHAAATINKANGQTNTIFMALDLADPKSVRNFARDWASNHPPIQVLLLNAGLQFPAELHKTPDGLEKTFAIAHVGHALLFHLLCPNLAQNARVIVTSSGTHDPAQKSGLPDAEYNSAQDLAYPPADMIKIPGRKRYSSTKLANVLWTYALAERLEARVPSRGITVNAFDPGLMPGTGLAREASGIERFVWNKVFTRLMPVLRALVSPNIHKPEDSGATLARLATAVEFQGVSGKYYEGKKEIPSSKDSYVKAKQEDLWEWTIKYCSNGEAADATRFEQFE